MAVFSRSWIVSRIEKYLQVTDRVFECHTAPQLAVSKCRTPCRMRGPILEHLVQQFETGADATIRIHDYRVQRFDIPLDLQGIGEGLSALKGLQNCFSAGSPTSPAASGD